MQYHGRGKISRNVISECHVGTATEWSGASCNIASCQESKHVVNWCIIYIYIHIFIYIQMYMYTTSYQKYLHLNHPSCISFIQRIHYLHPLEPSLAATSCLLPFPFMANLDRCLRTSDCSALS